MDCRAHTLIQKGKVFRNPNIQTRKVIEISFNEKTNHASNYMFNRDVALYALGIGACASNAVDEDELKYVYHEDGQQFIKVFFPFLNCY
jgi:hypothetical protein